MTTTTQQQLNAIRSAIKALQYDRHKVERQEQDDVTRQILSDIDDDIQALKDAQEVLRQTENFTASLKAFLA